MSAIMITGGAGYIGSHVAWACVDEGRPVVVLDSLANGRRENIPPQAVFVQADIADYAAVVDALRANDVTSVMHFAGSIIVPESVEKPLEYYDNNTGKTVQLLQACRDAGVARFVFSSTAAVYGPTLADCIGEDADKAPASPYGASKLMTETILRDMSAATGLDYAVLRYFNVAGADPLGRTGQSMRNATHLIKVASQAALGDRPVLDIFGDDYPTADGTCVRDYIHVSDLADAHLRALDHLAGHGGCLTLNCGYGRGASVKEIVRAFGDYLGRDLPVRIAPRRAGDPPRLVADTTQITQKLPTWTPRLKAYSDIIGTAFEWEKKLRASVD